MKKRLAAEWRVLSASMSRLCVWAGLTAAGGILLWVNGVMGPIRFRTLHHVAALPGFTVFFLLWLVQYALCGLSLGLCLLPVGCRSCHCHRAGSRCGWYSALAYLLLLTWYPLFFSLFHGFLASLVLTVAIGCHTLLLFRLGRGILCAIPVHVFTILGEIYFLYVTISSNLLN